MGKRFKSHTKIQFTPNEYFFNKRLIYIEQDTIGESGAVNTNILISVSYPGRVREGEFGILRTLNLTSEGYQPEFYFSQLMEQLFIVQQEFFEDIQCNYGVDADPDTRCTYNVDMEIYADADSIDNLYANSNQVKVFGVSYLRSATSACTVPSGDTPCYQIIGAIPCANWTSLVNEKIYSCAFLDNYCIQIGCCSSNC